MTFGFGNINAGVGFKVILLSLLTFSLSVYNTYGKSVDVIVFDCETHEPISDVQIFSDARKFLGTTNSEGKAKLIDIGSDKINFSKLGYEPLLLSADQINDVCLYKKSEKLSEVLISTQKLNYYDTLIHLSRNNRNSFLNNESTLTYSFNYKTTTLNGDSIIDEAKGYFSIRYYDDYHYPNLFSNTDDYVRVVDFEYQYDKDVPKSIFYEIKYLNPSTMLCCYDVMEKKFSDMDWWNYNNNESEKDTKYFEAENGGRKFATYTNNKQLSRYFYFDSLDVLQKVEVFRPSFFYGNNYDDEHCNFYLGVYYSSTLPRVVNQFKHTYQVNTPHLSYKTTLEIEQCHPQKQTLVVIDRNKKNYVFSLIGSFYQLFQEVEVVKKTNKTK